MGKNSAIEWTHHTFNPWWGCTKVSEACKNCYAEAWAKRTGMKVWGADADRRTFGEKHWHAPIEWNREAEKAHERRRVFCASMADVFEDRSQLSLLRSRLWRLIEETPSLDWLLLTKRPENIAKMIPWKFDWPENVWLGVTVENQALAAIRIPTLLKQPATIKFVSSEPLLGPIDLSPWISHIDWVIVGGESGHHARPMHPHWIKVIREQCLTANIPFYFKQWGNWRPIEKGMPNSKKEVTIHDDKGNTSILTRLGKKIAGRELDGKTWNEMPVIQRVFTKSFAKT